MFKASSAWSSAILLFSMPLWMSNSTTLYLVGTSNDYCTTTFNNTAVISFDVSAPPCLFGVGGVLGQVFFLQ